VKLSLTSFGLQLAIRSAVAVFLHECGHLLAMALVGVQGAYYSWDLNHVYFLEATTPRQDLIIYAGGGVFAALCFTLLNAEQEDSENHLINLFVAVNQLLYGLGEAVLPMVLCEGWSLVCQVAAAAVLFYVVYRWRPEWVV